MPAPSKKKPPPAVSYRERPTGGRRTIKTAGHVSYRPGRSPLGQEDIEHKRLIARAAHGFSDLPACGKIFSNVGISKPECIVPRVMGHGILPQSTGVVRPPLTERPICRLCWSRVCAPAEGRRERRRARRLIAGMILRVMVVLLELGGCPSLTPEASARQTGEAPLAPPARGTTSPPPQTICPH